MAAFSVFVFHYFRDIKAFYPGIETNTLFKVLNVVADKGSLGVNFFFVLSGFLITYLILKENLEKGKFSLIKFLIRRTLRIWPLYFIVILIGFLIFPLMFDSYHTQHEVLNYLFFLANFDEIKNGLHDSVNFLTAPWSVAVEEQFYLIWSLIFFFVLNWKGFKIEYLILFIYLLTFVFRWQMRDDERVIYYHTFSVCQDILTGAFFAIAFFKNKKWIINLIHQRTSVVSFIYIIGFLVCVLKNKIFSGDLIVVERFVLSLFFAFIIIDQALGKFSLFKIGQYHWLSQLGKISYGFYMYHLIVMFVLCKLVEMYLPTGYYLIPIYFLTALLFTILISWVSFKIIEEPLLKLKPKA